MKIVFLDASTLGDSSLERIGSLGELVTYPVSTRAEAIERVSDCEVLIVNKIVVDAGLMDAAPKLRLICEAATGVNNIDLAAAESRGVKVRNVPAYSTDSVAQSTFMHLLSLMGRAPYFDAFVKDGRYSRCGMFTDVSRPYTEIAGKTLGIIGMGAIGTKVAAIATAFGMRVVYYSTSGTSHNTDYPSVGLDNLLAVSDAASVHAPLNARTRNLISGAELRKMKPEAFVLNLGRGGVVDEAALAEAVDAGVIAGAAVDVFVTEPLPEDHPFMHLKHPERFRFSPHTAWASREAIDRLIGVIADNIRLGF